MNRGKYKKIQRNVIKDNRPKAHANYVRVSDMKARVVLKQIKGKNVGTAMAILEYSPRRASTIIQKVLKSAIANAESNINIDMDLEKLYVEEAIANAGPSMKRIRPKARGRAYPIIKRTSHISIILNERK